jgi:hypothetical protein
MPNDQQVTITQTPTGYWSVQRGAVHVVGAATRRGAEAERELLRRLSAARGARRARQSTGARPLRANASRAATRGL